MILLLFCLYKDDVGIANLPHREPPLRPPTHLTLEAIFLTNIRFAIVFLVFFNRLRYFNLNYLFGIYIFAF